MTRSNKRDEIIQKILEQSEDFFQTESDDTQIPTTHEATEKIILLNQHSIMYTLDDTGKLISWVTLIPTTEVLALQFIAGTINERELFDQTEPQKKYEALYLCAAYTDPKHRRSGYVFELFKKAIERIPCIENPTLFAWPVSFEGEQFLKKFSQILGKQIQLRV